MSAEKPFATKAPSLAFSNICYKVRQLRKDKQVLHSISGYCRGNELTAIMGPSGGGKSTLLDVLAGRKDPKKVDGTILLDGKAVDRKVLKDMSGYVQQEDLVMGMLTVRENITFSAELHLAGTHERQKRKDRVEEVIDELRLRDCADTFIGTELVRGVSGGEKKRCHIGMELVHRPALLFLDEPTTGLDSSTASTVMELLRSLKDRNVTVIFSIHQPRFTIFQKFDSLILLSRGKIVYLGLASKALQYLQGLGHICEEHNNPADFFLDVIQDDERSVKEAIMKHNFAIEDEKNAKDGAFLDEDSEAALSTLTEKFDRSPENVAIQAEIATMIKAANSYSPARSGFNYNSNNCYPTGFFNEMYWVGYRSVLSIIRNPTGVVGQLICAIFYGVLVGSIFHVDMGPYGLGDRTGAIFFLVMNCMFSNLTALDLFIRERQIYVKEVNSGYYRPSSYFISRVLCDILPMRIIPTLAFSLITYYMIGFRRDGHHPFFFVIIVLLCTLSSAGLCILISAVVSSYVVANLCCAVAYVLMLMVSGMLINEARLPVWAFPLKYISVFRYTLEALSINELQGLKFYCEGNSGPTCGDGDKFLAFQHYNPDRLVPDMLAMVAIFFMFLLFSFVAMRRLKTT